MRAVPCAALLLALLAMVPSAAAAPGESDPGAGIGPLTHFSLWQDDPIRYVVFADGKAPLSLNVTLAAGSDVGFEIFLDEPCKQSSAGDMVAMGSTVVLTCKLPRGHYPVDLSLGMGMVRGTLRVSNGMLQGAVP